ncbi:Hpt domain-containing protein [Thermodesulfobacteriota bacterium]
MVAGIRVKVDEDLFDLIPGYLSNRRQDIESMRDCLATGDFEAIRVVGHSMKGSGAGYGFDEITAIGAQIEQVAKANDGFAVSELISRLDDYLVNVVVVRDIEA